MHRELIYLDQALLVWFLFVALFITLSSIFFAASYPNVSITITFIEFGTECSIDYLFIYDGGSYLSPLIGAFSGNTLPETVVAHSGQVRFLQHCQVYLIQPLYAL